MNAPRVFLVTAGLVFALLAAVGSVLGAMGENAFFGQYLLFDTPHNVVHAALAAVALGLGFAPLPGLAHRRSALALGVLYLALAVAGFIRGDLWDVPESLGWKIHLELTENMAHLILGGWGAYVGSQENDEA